MTSGYIGSSLEGHFIHAEEMRNAEDKLEALLLEGLNSAETELTPADWSAIRKEAVAKVAARKLAR